MDFHLVSHTHWDREWYRTAEVFRQRLVDLIDELIEVPPSDGESFLLDGQAIVLQDYLDVRPSQRERLRGLLQSGRMEAGPWYVLADELIPSGEAIVRNLLLGRHSLAGLGATSPPVLYCPDSFGHPAALPEIANGFGLPLIILWRGYGGRRWPNGDVVRWAAPSGVDAIVFHLPPDGYEFGASLPLDRDASVERWKRVRETLAGRSTVGVTLLQNGADHHARQAGRASAIEVLFGLVAESGDRLRVGSLRSFSEALVQRAQAQRLPTISGELRDSYGYTWTLQGTFGTRAAQKRANAIGERALRQAEAWSAAARLSGGPSRVDQLRAGWRTLLEAQPHDTLCGTSIDDVAAAMDVRLRSARLQGESLAARAIEALMQHDAAAVREQKGTARDVVVVENAVPYARGGIVLIEQIEKIVDEPVGPGSGDGPRLEAVAAEQGEVSAVKGTQVMTSVITRNRIESARHYPDNDIVRATTVACYVKPTAGFGLRVLDGVATEVEPPSKVRATRDSIATDNLRATFDKLGAVTITFAGHELANLIRFEDRVDAGDLYTPSLREVASHARCVRQRITHRGPLIGELAQDWVFAADREKRGSPRATLSLSLRLIADSPLIEVHVVGENRATNHRLRVGFSTGIEATSVQADAAFGPVERKPFAATAEDQRMETPPATAPLHRYVSLFSRTDGASVHADGLAEYEVDDAGVVWITLVRAVGDLSRNDLPERPGHAGWPEETPAAQSLGRFEARFAFHAHGPLTPATLTTVERESDRFLTPLRGFTLRSTTTGIVYAGGIELAGTGLAASAIKESEDGRSIVLRCVNLSDREQRGVWTLCNPIAEAHLARLDETPLGKLDVASADDRSTIGFTAGPRSVITILARG
ncbi:MAG: glycoside hydrolase family 38 C-terminal domain-containing protein [Gemmatimonadaceae bacterium]